jgi:hypothetical protein
MRRRVLELAEQFPRIWSDPRVDMRERKRILRLLVDDVTLIKTDAITAHVWLSGGATRTLRLDRPLPIAQIRKFKQEVVIEVDRLRDSYRDREIADILNQRGRRTWEAKPFNLKKIAFIRGDYNLASRHQRLRDRGKLTTAEVAARFGVSETAVHRWGRYGLIKKCYRTIFTAAFGTCRQTLQSPRNAEAASLARLRSCATPRHQPDRVQYEAFAFEPTRPERSSASR